MRLYNRAGLVSVKLLHAGAVLRFVYLFLFHLLISPFSSLHSLFNIFYALANATINSFYNAYTKRSGDVANARTKDCFKCHGDRFDVHNGALNFVGIGYVYSFEIRAGTELALYPTVKEVRRPPKVKTKMILRRW
ncbi:hypothetical protein F4809DRAFT_625514 [Biscogniauxia mediterranea]|nr:hypothetical protein F4809DRAFT_625514 [Biscogniauxia mediterranea]